MRNVRVRRIAGFGLTSADADRSAEFYATAFGARRVSSGRLEGARFERCLGVRGGARRHTVAVGREAIEILEFDTPGRPYPSPLSPDDTAFQHFAIVVSDMDRALSMLQRAPGWTAITNDGPQRLPQRSGGVTAFKFRDPDGHPLELLAFPGHAVPAHWKKHCAEAVFQGIDHSAISVSDTGISTAYYERLGFGITARASNRGDAQGHLDGVAHPQVEVTALSLATATPHLELLCYRSGARPRRPTLASNDLAATRIALTLEDADHDADAIGSLVIDPDGHHLLLAR